MLAFSKSIRKADKVRRYTIQTTSAGWEVRQEQNSEVVREARYHDWHRVERAQRAFMIEMRSLSEEGWTEV
jgi:hypothetical protein